MVHIKGMDSDILLIRGFWNIIDEKDITFGDRIYTLENLKVAWNIRQQNESVNAFKAYLRELKIDEILND